MTPSELQFLMDTLETRNNQFGYFKDQYALDLLKYFVTPGMEVSALKKSQFGFLTSKKVVKKQLAVSGKRVSADVFNCSTTETINFNYSLSQWGTYSYGKKQDYYQTSRDGINLVLQLNFESLHNEAYYEFIEPKKGQYPFINTSHPVVKPKKNRELTMGWVRMDVDLNNGEVLIEEIQNDWLREASEAANWAYRRVRNWKARESDKHTIFEAVDPKSFMVYFDKYLKKYIEVWDEALLDLAIRFSKDELGCSVIYYNTFETGNHFKGMPNYSLPPKSLYTKLPRKFGFATTNQPPYMLIEDKHLRKKFRKGGLKWYLLTL